MACTQSFHAIESPILLPALVVAGSAAENLCDMPLNQRKGGKRLPWPALDSQNLRAVSSRTLS
jgi:hypothetical protein